MIYDRRPKPSFGLDTIPMIAIVFAIGVLFAMIGIWILSRPSSASPRIAALESQLDNIKAARHAAGDLQKFPMGTVCTSNIDDGFKTQLNVAIMNTGLHVDAIDIASKGQAGDTHPLMVYSLTVRGSGSYEAAVNAMQILSAQKPQIFLDSMALRNKTGSVDLDVEGRFYCRWTKQD